MTTYCYNPASFCFLYNGQLGVQTDQNGLYYMRARYYNTDIKRFINRDTVSGDLTNSQSLNRYAYVQGNPINQTDPFGLYPIGDVLNILSQAGHMLLDTAGFFWDGFDLINAAWYQAEGNELMAMTSAVSAIPFMGSMVAGGTRLAFKGSKAAKVASKAADYISNLSKLAGYTGQVTISAIDTGYAYQDYKSAKANGTATDADFRNVKENILLTLETACGLSAATKVTARVKADGVGDSVKASAKDNMSGSKGSSGMGAPARKEHGGGSTSLWTPAAKQNQLWNKGKLKKHYEKHGIPQFGAKSSKEYSDMAYEFGTRKSDSIIEVIEESYVYRYEPSTNNIFVGTLKGGKIKSFYKWDGRENDAVIETLKRLGKL